MNKEQRLIKLLQIAVENGWIDIENFYFNRTNEILEDNISVWSGEHNEDFEIYSLNDLVLNWKEGQLSFIESLFKSMITGVEDRDEVIDSYIIYFRMQWVNLPTSERLNHLFTTFKSLL